MKQKSKAEKLNDLGSWLTVVITLVLFIVALFEKGFTHDLLLEAGVFLVSVKLVLAAQKNKRDTDRLENKIDRLLNR